MQVSLFFHTTLQNSHMFSNFHSQILLRPVKYLLYLSFIPEHKRGKFQVSIVYKKLFSFHKPKRQNYFGPV